MSIQKKTTEWFDDPLIQKRDVAPYQERGLAFLKAFITHIDKPFVKIKVFVGCQSDAKTNKPLGSVILIKFEEEATEFPFGRDEAERMSEFLRSMTPTLGVHAENLADALDDGLESAKQFEQENLN